jgi:FixJ family two-component response regulator
MQRDLSITVYVVEDEPSVTATLTAILRNAGFRAIGFTDSSSALESAPFDAPGLLIADVFMPGLNGIELALRFKSECPDCKILLISGHGAASDMLRFAAEQGHHFDFLAKPFHPEHMLEAIRNAFTGDDGRAVVSLV